MMNKKWMAIAAASVVLFSSAAVSAQAEEPARRSITVTGSAEVVAKSDMATLNVSVENSAATAKEAARENANTMTAVRNAVIAAGADASKIQTQNYYIYPQQQYDNKGRVTSTSYNCQNSLKVVVPQLDKASGIMDAAVNAGANRIDSMEFSVSDTDAYRDQALAAAVKDARHKADIIAAALGRSVVNVISVDENNVNVVPFRMANMKLAASAVASDAATPVEGGETKMQGRVTVVFEID